MAKGTRQRDQRLTTKTMNNMQILWALFALGIIGTILTQLRRRTTSVGEWFKENTWGLLAGLVTGLTTFLIGAGDDVSMGSFMARTWAAGIGPLTMYIVGGNVTTPAATHRRSEMRATAKAVKAAEDAA